MEEILKNENVRICAECGGVIENDECYKEYDGKFYHEDCFYENYDICEECGEIIPKGESIYIEDDDVFVCEYCYDEYYFECANCGRIEHKNREYYSRDGSICEYCADYEYTICDDCGERLHNDSILYSEGDDCYYCEDCYNYHNNVDRAINNYHNSHNKEVVFFGGVDDGKNLFEGVELEIDNGEYSDREPTALAMKEVMPQDFITMENDGSLDSGFENITQPATLDYHLSIKDKYQKMFDIALENGFRSHNTTTCGYHIHFNRTFFEDKQDECIAKLLYLVEKFWDELVKFSRRNYSALERWAKKYYDEPQEVIRRMKSFNLDRYHAVNLTNRHTIEFRMFRGTMNIETFMATLQLVDTIVRYVKNHSNNDIQSMEFTDLLVTDDLKNYWEKVKNRNC